MQFNIYNIFVYLTDYYIFNYNNISNILLFILMIHYIIIYYIQILYKVQI